MTTPMLVRVLRTESLKLKRTLALWMVVVAPILVVVLQFCVGYFGGERISRGKDAWPGIVQNSLALWTILMMPMFVTLETSLLAGLEHTDRNWKTLLALPAPRWTIYVSKLLVTVALLWIAHLILIAGTLTSGTILRAVQPALHLNALPWEPVVNPLLRISAAALLGLTIQHWVSLRWQTFTTALGFGMCVMVISFIAANAVEWGRWFPWSMPLMIMRPGKADVEMLLYASIAGAFVCAALGCWEFIRREIA